MARTLTVDQLVKTGMSKEQAEQVIALQSAPAVRRRVFVIDSPLTDDEAMRVSKAINLPLKPRFKSQPKKGNTAPKAQAGKPPAGK